MKADSLFPPEFPMAGGRLTAVNTITNHPRAAQQSTPAIFRGIGLNANRIPFLWILYASILFEEIQGWL